MINNHELQQAKKEKGSKKCTNNIDQQMANKSSNEHKKKTLTLQAVTKPAGKEETYPCTLHKAKDEVNLAKQKVTLRSSYYKHAFWLNFLSGYEKEDGSVG